MMNEEVDEELSQVFKQINAEIQSISDADSSFSLEEEPNPSRSSRLHVFKSLSENGSLLGSPRSQAQPPHLKDQRSSWEGSMLTCLAPDDFMPFFTQRVLHHVPNQVFQKKRIGICLCNLHSVPTATRNLRIRNVNPVNVDAIHQFLMTFGDIQGFDTCQLPSLKEVLVSFHALTSARNAFNNLVAQLPSGRLQVPQVEFLMMSNDFTAIDYLLLSGTGDGNLEDREVHLFFSFFWQIVEMTRFPKVIYVKFDDVRSIKNVEKYLANYKESDMITLNICRGIFPQINERKLRLLLSNTNIFTFENSTDIFLNNIDFRKLNQMIKEETSACNFSLPSKKKHDETQTAKFLEAKRKSLKITSQSFSGLDAPLPVPAVFMDKTNMLFPAEAPLESPHSALKENLFSPAHFPLLGQEKYHKDKPALDSQGVIDGSLDDQSKFMIDLERIDSGLDLRTTLMIRNIPNRYIQGSLLQTINGSFRGLYDFFYLPMDFKNKCNIGYAFINFINPRSIVEFFKKFNNRRWDHLRSEKICCICYARLQGRSQLIKHFKRSTIMSLSLENNYKPLILPNAEQDLKIF